MLSAANQPKKQHMGSIRTSVYQPDVLRVIIVTMHGCLSPLSKHLLLQEALACSVDHDGQRKAIDERTMNLVSHGCSQEAEEHDTKELHQQADSKGLAGDRLCRKQTGSDATAQYSVDMAPDTV